MAKVKIEQCKCLDCRDLPFRFRPYLVEVKGYNYTFPNWDIAIKAAFGE